MGSIFSTMFNVYPEVFHEMLGLVRCEELALVIDQLFGLTRPSSICCKSMKSRYLFIILFVIFIEYIMM